MMTDSDWLAAWQMYRNGANFADIERHYGKGHRTIASGFIRRGWYCPQRRMATDAAPDAKRPQKPSRTAFVEPSKDVGSDKGWTPTRIFMAHWLAERGHGADHIAEVVNLPVATVQKYLGQIERRAA